MSLSSLQMENGRIAARTRRCIGVSVVVHVLILSCLALLSPDAPPSALLAEITWIEPAALEPTPVVAPAVAPEALEEERISVPREIKLDTRLVRTTEVAQVATVPQSEVLSDQLRGRLGAPAGAHVAQALQAGSGAPMGSLLGRAAPGPDYQSGNTTLELKRGEGFPGPALELKRATAPGPGGRLAEVAARAGDPRGGGPRQALAPAAASAGPSLGANGMSGPAADRALRTRVLPHYPDWAKREGVEASVSLYFIVLPDGSVKPNVLVQKTSGFQDFDREARQALLAWIFEPLSGANAAEQWGSITFNFRLTTLP